MLLLVGEFLALVLGRLRGFKQHFTKAKRETIWKRQQGRECMWYLLEKYTKHDRIRSGGLWEFSRVLGRSSSAHHPWSPGARSFLETCVSTTSRENHLHRRAISRRREAFSIVVFYISTPVHRISPEEWQLIKATHRPALIITALSVSVTHHDHDTPAGDIWSFSVLSSDI